VIPRSASRSSTSRTSRGPGWRACAASCASHRSDEELRALVELAEAALADIPRPPEPPDELVICPDVRIGDEVVRTVSMVARFDTARELTLDELQIELTYPRDAAAERFFRARATG
jgi:hypothetical protein